MIHDKDYIIRMVKEFSNFLSKLLLGKNEGELEDSEMAFETQMRDIFKMSFEELASKSREEIEQMISEKDLHHQADYYDLLGNLFYFAFKKDPTNKEIALKAKTFYELWIQKSSVFSIPIMGRITELSAVTN